MRTGSWQYRLRAEIAALRQAKPANAPASDALKAVDVQAEVNRWLEVLLPELHKERTKARKAVAARKRILTRGAFNKLMHLVHPDTAKQATVKEREWATRIMLALKPLLLDEKDEPTVWDSDLPNDLAGWGKRMADADLKRKLRSMPKPKPPPLPPHLPPQHWPRKPKS